MKNVAFTPVAFEEYNEWFIARPEIIKRIKELIRDIDRDPFKGIGKPEPLKGNWSGYWSRRMNQEHRLVYKISVSRFLLSNAKDIIEKAEAINTPAHFKN